MGVLVSSLDFALFRFAQYFEENEFYFLISLTLVIPRRSSALLSLGHGFQSPLTVYSNHLEAGVEYFSNSFLFPLFLTSSNDWV